MMVWYVCPYDVGLHRGTVRRIPAISRYIPTFPDPNGGVWDEVEIMGNHILVKVIAPSAVHATIAMDPDFLVIPNPVPPLTQTVLLNKLQTLGYLDQEILDTGWDTLTLLQLLASARSPIAKNITNDGIVVQAGRLPPAKTVDDINKRLPG